MNSDQYPVVVVAAYNRPQLFKLLLSSLLTARYPEVEVRLIISIDGGGPVEVVSIAENFVWPFGTKEIIKHTQNLGLKSHILTCGDLTKKHGPVILLESDLIVGPEFYEFGWNAMAFYRTEPRIGGISLFGYEITEDRFLPFQPLDDGSDTYFIQFTSSWGQLWTSEQWSAFRAWFEENKVISEGEKLPKFIRDWTENSWKREFNRYLQATDKYFVFPRLSHTTNPGKPGTNSDREGIFQVPLCQSSREYVFLRWEDSDACYDMFFEPNPETIKQIVPSLNSYDFTVDLYGGKDAEYLDKEFVLTTRRGITPLQSYGLEMVPNILNLKYNIPGQDILFLKTENLNHEFRQTHFYFYCIRAITEDLFNEYLLIQSRHLAQKLAEEMAQDLAEDLSNLKAKEKVGQAVDKAIDELLYSQNFSCIGLLILVDEHTTEIEIDQTRKSVESQAYPFTEIWEIKRENIGLEELFAQSKAEIFTWVSAGTTWNQEAFNQVNQIFKRYPEINILAGSDGISLKNRLSRAAFFKSNPRDLQTVFYSGNVFWKRYLGEKVAKGNDYLKKAFSFHSGLGFWANLIANDQLFCWTQTFSNPAHLKNYPQPSTEEIIAYKAIVSKLQHDFPSGHKLFYFCYLNKLPLLSSFYMQRYFLPKVVRYSKEEETFFLSSF